MPRGVRRLGQFSAVEPLCLQSWAEEMCAEPDGGVRRRAKEHTVIKCMTAASTIRAGHRLCPTKLLKYRQDTPCVCLGQ